MWWKIVLLVLDDRLFTDDSFEQSILAIIWLKAFCNFSNWISEFSSFPRRYGKYNIFTIAYRTFFSRTNKLLRCTQSKRFDRFYLPISLFCSRLLRSVNVLWKFSNSFLLHRWPFNASRKGYVILQRGNLVNLNEIVRRPQKKTHKSRREKCFSCNQFRCQFQTVWRKNPHRKKRHDLIALFILYFHRPKLAETMETTMHFMLHLAAFEFFHFFCCRCEQKSACESARLFALVKLLLTGVLITWHWISLGKWGNDKSVNKINNELLNKNKNRVSVLASAVESARFLSQRRRNYFEFCQNQAPAIILSCF